MDSHRLKTAGCLTAKEAHACTSYQLSTNELSNNWEKSTCSNVQTIAQEWTHWFMAIVQVQTQLLGWYCNQVRTQRLNSNYKQLLTNTNRTKHNEIEA